MSEAVARLYVAVDSREAKTAKKDLDNLATSGERAEKSVGGLGRVMAGLGVAAGIGLAARQIYSTNAEFERLNTSLVTVTRSQDRANQVFGELQQFAAVTPFQLREVTEAYIMMRARGLDPTTATMTSLGNLASGMGRTFQDTIGAVGSLAAGEIEPMKQLGFSVMTIGDKVRLSSGGVSESVSRNAYDISKAVARIADVKFAGGMERQVNTIGGAFSNLQDQVDATIYKMGQQGLNAGLVKSIQSITASINEATPALAHFAEGAVSGSVSAVRWLGEHRNAVLMLGAAYGAVKVGGIATFTAGGLQAAGAYIQSLQVARAENLAYAEAEVRSTAATLEGAEAQLAKARAVNFSVVQSTEQAALAQAAIVQEEALTRAVQGRAAAEAELTAVKGARLGGATVDVTTESLSEISLAEARVAAATATVAENEAELLRIKTMQEGTAVNFEAVAMERVRAAQEAQLAAATEANTAALTRQTVAQRANSTAAMAGGVASRGFGAIVSALGGPVGAITTGLILAGTAAYLWGDKLKTSATKASEGAEKYLVKLREEVALLERRKGLETSQKPWDKMLGKVLSDDDLKHLDAILDASGKQKARVVEAQKSLNATPDDRGLNDRGSRYQERLSQLTDEERALRTLESEYNEIIKLAQDRTKILDENAAKAKAASEKDAKDTADNAKREMELQKQAMEAQKLVEERKTFVRDLRKENAIGGAELATGLAGTETTKAEQEIVTLEAQAKRLGIVGNEMALVYERESQIRQKANAEKAAKDAEAENSRNAQEASSYADELSRVREEYELLGASIEKQVRFKALDIGLTEGQIQAEISLRTALEGAQYAMNLDNEESRSAKRSLEMQKLNDYLKGGAISAGAFAQRMGELRVEGNTTLQGLTAGLQGMGQTASEAFGRWVAGMDGAALSGRKLFQQLIADMARLQAQKGWDALITMGLKALGGLGGSKDPLPYSGGYNGVLGGGFDIPTGSVVNAPAPDLMSSIQAPAASTRASAGGTTVQTSIVVNIASDGTATTKATSDDGNAFAKELERQFKPMVLGVVLDAMRPNGALNRAGSMS